MTFLGTGAAGGVPLYGCNCVACERAAVDPSRIRRPSSVLIEHDGIRFACLTDTLGLPPQTEAFLQAWQADGLAIDCSYPPQDAPPRGHNDWPMALAAIASVRPRRAWLTHIGHALDAWMLETAPQLPDKVCVARDGAGAALGCGREHHAT